MTRYMYVLPWAACLPTLMLIAQAVFLLECGQTDKQTDSTGRLTPRRRLYSRRGNDTTTSVVKISLIQTRDRSVRPS